MLKVDTSKTKNKKRQRRATIPDSCITLEQFKEITFNICNSIMEYDLELSQKNIINKALDFHLSNKKISEVINYLLPDSAATAGSVASMIRFLSGQALKNTEYINFLEGIKAYE